MNRRGFLQAILAAGVAPAAIGSNILMPVKMVQPPKKTVDYIAVTNGAFTDAELNAVLNSMFTGEQCPEPLRSSIEQRLRGGTTLSFV